MTALLAIAEKLTENKDLIISANKIDTDSAESNGISKAMIDRLMINSDRIDGIVSSLHELCGLTDPVGSGERWNRPNGLEISKVRVPLGDIADNL